MKVNIKQLKKSYHEDLILNLNEIEFKENKTTCILGRNGTGKTTLLKIIANLLSYDSGEILYNQSKINEKVMKEMTYVSQNPYIYQTTVYNNIIYPLKLRKLKVTKEVDDYLEYFEMTHLKSQNAIKCSSGEKMKVAIIRALVFKPKLLLLDEPTTNLDIESIEKFTQLLLKIKKDTTIIFISHNKDLIKRISDTVFVLKDKKLKVSENNV